MARSLIPEIMDTGAYTPDEYETCLRQLAVINHLTMGYHPTLKALARVARFTSERPVRVLDIGFGYGDSLREISVWAKKNKVAVDLVGVELNPMATQIAERATPPDLQIKFQTQDIFSLPPDQKFHVVTCSLMAHHLDDKEIRALLDWMTKHSTVAWFVNDLHRHWLAYWFIKLFSRLAGFNRLIQNDGPLSVQRSFVRSEWIALIQSSGLNLTRATIRWWWSFRYGIFYRVA